MVCVCFFSFSFLSNRSEKLYIDVIIIAHYFSEGVSGVCMGNFGVLPEKNTNKWQFDVLQALLLKMMYFF